VSLRLQILDLIGDLQKKHGMAVLLITHDLNLVRKFADRIAVMENGHLVEQGAVSAVFAQPQHAYTQRLLASKPVRDVLPAHSDAPVMMAADDLRVTYPVPLGGFKGWFKKGEFVAVKNTTLTLKQGQTLGIIGESGSGKSTLAMALLGLLAKGAAQGKLFFKKNQPSALINTAPSAMESIASIAFDPSLRQQLQVVFQDPFSSLSPRMTVQEIVGEGLLARGGPGRGAVSQSLAALSA
jgi:microcin C transport system ATP-binding protein